MKSYTDTLNNDNNSRKKCYLIQCTYGMDLKLSLLIVTNESRKKQKFQIKVEIRKTNKN